MTVVLVTHATEMPALDAMIAGEIAAERGARLTTLVSGGAGLARFDCLQHVMQHGELGPNGLLWAERASGRPVLPPVDRGSVARLEDATVLVPINPAILAQAEAVARIEAAAAAAGRPLEHYGIAEREDVFVVSRRGRPDPVDVWRRDAFGRPVRAGGDADRASGGGPVRILVIGDESLQREVYPANLAAIGDAADHLGQAVALRFADPSRALPRSWGALLREVDGLLLPGGSDMEQVRGQIAVARAAIRADIPTLGLCLGMQTMSTALAQDRAGLTDASLAEADPDAPIKTFVRLHDDRGRPEFRLGPRRCRVVAGTHFAALVDGAAGLDVHCNHRFVLDPRLHAPLVAAGLRLCGLQADQDLADAIEVPALRFFMGMQGHPELASRRARPHPMILGFLAAAGAMASPLGREG